MGEAFVGFRFVFCLTVVVLLFFAAFFGAAVFFDLAFGFFARALTDFFFLEVFLVSFLVSEDSLLFFGLLVFLDLPEVLDTILTLHEWPIELLTSPICPY